MAPEEAVPLAVRLIAENSGASDTRLVARMVAADLDRDLANRLAVLVPLAFSRVHYETFSMTTDYAAEYIVFDERTEQESTRELADDPCFVLATSDARAKAKSNGSLVEAIARRSNEYHAIKDILKGLPDGATPSRIATSSPYVVLDDPPDRPWWKFW